MITWIRENAALASIAVSLVVAISTGAVAYHQLSGLVAAQPEIQNHIHDTARHIDPVRDTEDKKRMEERIDQLERQMRWMERRQNGEWRPNGEWQNRRVKP